MKRCNRIVCAIIFPMFGSLLCGIGLDFSKATFGLPGFVSIIIGIIFGFSLLDCQILQEVINEEESYSLASCFTFFSCRWFRCNVLWNGSSIQNFIQGHRSSLSGGFTFCSYDGIHLNTRSRNEKHNKSLKKKWIRDLKNKIQRVLVSIGSLFVAILGENLMF